MRASVILCLSLIASGCSSLEPLSEPLTEVIDIETVDFPGTLWDPFMPSLSEGTPVTIEGRLTIPPTETPVPGVIVTHGCGGVGGAERGWVDDLRDDGYASLLLDSFGGRGIAEICTGRETLKLDDR